MKDLVELPTVIYDERARNGVWCTLPYPDHPKGCPNFPKCIQSKPDFLFYYDHMNLKWYAAIEEFDLKSHSEEMKRKHPDWSERQCRNLLYWQGGVRKRLLNKAHRYVPFSVGSAHVLELPEACGINVFATMAKVGVILRKNPDYVRKVMFVGIPQKSSEGLMFG